MNKLEHLLNEYKSLGIGEQIDYGKFYLYSIITHSTAIEGSTVSEVENQLLFDDGISPNRPIAEQLMNLDLKAAYAEAFRIADAHRPMTVDVLCQLAALVMKNTGARYSTALGEFDAAKGELRRLNVSAGRGGASYLAWQKVPRSVQDFCAWLDEARQNLGGMTAEQIYAASFEAHYQLAKIHPWADGNGRMARLLMNLVQRQGGVVLSIVKKEKRAEYIESLARAQDGEAPGIFLDFMLRHHAENIQEQIWQYRRSTGDESGDTP
ncbi:MAG: Fic family protein [Ottowia sp.]|nr:Fic family protein [Ottowia sp.]